MGQANDIEIFKRALNREKAARKEAERILEEKSFELYNVTEELKNTNIKLEKILREKTLELEGAVDKNSNAISKISEDKNRARKEIRQILTINHELQIETIEEIRTLEEKYERERDQAIQGITHENK